jgi:hypothetical protein
MKKKILGPVGTLCMFAVSMTSPVLAAELLDVNPVTSGSGVVIEVTADIPMTYTYYKVPGQARAVVDIADADPEKVEPLIVVNKGAVSSISVDKAMIADMTVSRLVFNLVSETDINVKQAADRKKLTVSFGDTKSVVDADPVTAPASVVAAIAPAVPVVAPVVAPEPKIVKEQVAPPVGSALSKEEEDPLGLDEPKSPAAAPVTAPVASRSEKLEPVVPVSTERAPSTDVVVKGVVIGSSYIDIQVKGNLDKIKHMKISKPDRLAIDIPGTSSMTKKSVSVNKFGISKVRIGNTPGVVRVVLDASRPQFPAYSVDFTENGIRINFK